MFIIVRWSSKISLKSVKFNFHFSDWLNLQSYLVQQTPQKLVEWFQNYRQLKGCKNNRKQRNYLLVWLYLKISICWFWFILLHHITYWFRNIPTLRLHYAHAAANLNSGHSKYAKVARVHYFCTIALRTSRAVLTRAWASRRVNLRELRVDSFSKWVIIFCW